MNNAGRVKWDQRAINMIPLVMVALTWSFMTPGVLGQNNCLFAAFATFEQVSVQNRQMIMSVC
jgi:hypothetical protein